MGQRALTVNIARPREERSRGGFGSNRQGGRQHANRGGSRRY